jgi:hypothetical protein
MVSGSYPAFTVLSTDETSASARGQLNLDSRVDMILSPDRIDGVQIGNRVYWTLTTRNCKQEHAVIILLNSWNNIGHTRSSQFLKVFNTHLVTTSSGGRSPSSRIQDCPHASATATLDWLNHQPNPDWLNCLELSYLYHQGTFCTKNNFPMLLCRCCVLQLASTAYKIPFLCCCLRTILY